MTNPSYEDFRKKLLKIDKKKHFDVKNSYSVRDAYRWIRKNLLKKNKNLVSEHDFRIIIGTLNKFYADKLLRTTKIRFPLQLGELEIVKKPIKTTIVNGRINTNRKIDWKRTLHLWHEDEDAMKNKILVRHDVNESFRIAYKKTKAKYKNKSFMNFSAVRDIKLKLKDKINRGETDALLNVRQNEFYKY